MPLLCLTTISLLHVGALASLLAGQPVAEVATVRTTQPVPVTLVAPRAVPERPVEPTPVPQEPVAVTPAKPTSLHQIPLHQTPPQPTSPAVAAAPTADVAPVTPAATAPVAAPATATDMTDRAAATSEPVFDADYLNNPAPPYPSQSRKKREQGVVWLRVHVTADGQADQLELLSSSGHERLDDAALRTVRRWQFVPARQGDVAVAAWVRVPVRFALKP